MLRFICHTTKMQIETSIPLIARSWDMVFKAEHMIQCLLSQLIGQQMCLSSGPEKLVKATKDIFVIQMQPSIHPISRLIL